MILFLTLACGSRPAEVSPPPAPVEVPATTADAPVIGRLDLPAPIPSAWSSPSCGGRAWERRLEILAEGRFRGQDRVSPCPEGTTCIWSGVVERAGTWRIDAGQLILALDQPGTMPVAEPMAGSVKQVGESLEDDLGCSYVRVPQESSK